MYEHEQILGIIRAKNEIAISLPLVETFNISLGWARATEELLALLQAERNIQ